MKRSADQAYENPLDKLNFQLLIIMTLYVLKYSSCS